MTTVTLRKVGANTGLVLPAETRLRLGLQLGDELTLVELADGVKLVKHNPVLQAQIAQARKVVRRAAPVLQELAKA